MKNKSAFPILEHTSPDANFNLTDTGMNLRDYFAGQALVGILSNGEYGIGKNINSLNIKTAISDTAFEIADAMLAAREKE